MMLTRCPACDTAFRVTPDQLKARAGKVRCGHCNAVFNALETLADTPPPPVPQAPGAATPPAEPVAPPRAESPPAEPPLEEGRSEPPAVLPDEADEQAAISILLEEIGHETAPPASRGRLLAWGLGGLLALALLVVQAAYLYRAELAVNEPGLRPLLEEMCTLLECDIPLPRKADLVSIEASDLHPDPQRKGQLVLVATLKNRASFAQDFPYLELTLTDTRDQPMVRKILAPSDYLAQGVDVRAGFAANGDMVVSLWLDAADVGASGYRLYLFYP